MVSRNDTARTQHSTCEAYVRIVGRPEVGGAELDSSSCGTTNTSKYVTVQAHTCVDTHSCVHNALADSLLLLMVERQCPFQTLGSRCVPEPECGPSWAPALPYSWWQYCLRACHCKKCDRCAALCYLRYAKCVTAWLCWWLQVARWVLLLCYANQTLRDGWAGSGSLSEKPHKSRH